MRKKLFAVIMSAMMMITFMPTMAFAGIDSGSASWNDSYSHVAWTETTGGEKEDFDCDANRYPATGTTGSMTKVDGTVAVGDFNGWMKAIPKKSVSGLESVEYRDFSAATITKLTNGTDTIDVSGKITYADAVKLFGENFDKDADVAEVKFTVPAYALNRDKAWEGHEENTVADMEATANANMLAASGAGYSFSVVAPAFNAEKMFTENQTFDLVVLVDADQNHYKSIGKPSLKLTVKKDKAEAGKATYLWDGKDLSTTYYYDGAEHKITQKAMTGVSSTYKMFSRKTGNYENVTGDAVVVKNVAKYYIAPTQKDATATKKIEPELTPQIKESCSAQATFKGTAGLNNTFSYKVAGKFDAKEYVTINAVDVVPNQKKAANAAIKADQKAIAAYLYELYDVVVDEDNIASFELREGVEKSVVDKKYAELLANYGDITVDTTATAKFKVIDDITFTKAPLTKTFKAKNGKLSKAKKFAVKAKAASGATLVYKVKSGAGKIVINRTTGKVTVKKGLKKGTYKVTVKAITLDSFGKGDEEIFDSYTLKIKVK